MIATAEPAPIAPSTTQPKANPIETFQKTVSASRLNCWLSCRLKFFFRYVQGIIKPSTPALHVGSVVHLVLQARNMARWRKQAFELERFKSLFDTGWADQPAKINWDDEEPTQKSGAWSLLEVYFTETPIKANELPEAVEVPSCWLRQRTMFSSGVNTCSSNPNGTIGYETIAAVFDWPNSRSWNWGGLRLLAPEVQAYQPSQGPHHSPGHV